MRGAAGKPQWILCLGNEATEQTGEREHTLREEIRRVFEENHRIYGSRKIGHELSRPERPVNRKRVARLMKQMGLRSKVCKKYKATIHSNHNLPVTENLLNREFAASLPNEKWLGDITYVPTDEGWLYLCGVMDLHSMEIVGWAMDSRMKTDLCLGALRQAILRRGRPKGVLFHSDRGSQYCAAAYQAELNKHDFICSMSRRGNCWDNAPMESFWGKLKQEWLNDQHFHTRRNAMTAIFYYIEVFYNRKRHHAGLGYAIPSLRRG